MLTQKHIIRISIPIEEFGTIGLRRMNAIEAKLKRVRKRAFNDLARIIKLYRIVSTTQKILSISRGLTSDGTVTLEITAGDDNA